MVIICSHQFIEACGYIWREALTRSALLTAARRPVRVLGLIAVQVVYCIICKLTGDTLERMMKTLISMTVKSSDECSKDPAPKNLAHRNQCAEKVHHFHDRNAGRTDDSLRSVRQWANSCNCAPESELESSTIRSKYNPRYYQNRRRSDLLRVLANWTRKKNGAK